MTEDELASFLDEQATRAIGHYGSTIASEQARVLDYYYGRMEDVPAQEGCSSAVDGTVQVTVDNFVANIVKPFVSTNEAVQFSPVGPDDEEAAQQATDYVNYVYLCDNPGFQITHDWAKDAGMQTLGVVKCYWQDTTNKRPQLIEALDAVQAEQMEFVDGPYVDEMTGLYSGYVMADYADGRVKIENIPPEEYLISPLARPGDVPPYEAQRTRMTRSDLLEMGFDPEIVADLPAADGAGFDTRSQSRYRDEQAGGQRGDGFADPSVDMIEVYHEFAQVDFDGDGFAELREVIRVDTVLLYNEESDGGVFHRYCPIPMPHKVYGSCPGNLVVNDQRVKTVLLRQQLDNLYKSNNPRPVVGSGALLDDGQTADSLNDSAPGAAINLRDIAQFRFDAVPFVADKVFQMQEYTDREIERKTGIAKEGQSLDHNATEATNSMTATQANHIEEASNTRAELMARIFAETGFRSLFKAILRLLVKHQPRERMIRLRNKWVPMDPRQWNADMDVEISVGLGIGNRREQIAQADSVLMTMAELVQSPYGSLVSEENAYNAVKRKYTASGIKNTDDYITEPPKGPDGKPLPKQPQPSPEEMKLQAEMQMQQAKLQGEQQLQAVKLRMQQEEAVAKQQLAREQAEFEAQLAAAKAEQEAALAQQKLAMELQIAEQRMAMEERMAEHKASIAERQAESKLSTNRPGGSLAE